MNQDENYGQSAYETYCETRGWKSFDGKPLPQWRQQSEALREAWIAAAGAVLNEHRIQTRPG